MATGVTTEKLFSRMSLETFFHDPDSASSVPVTSDGGTTKYWRDMRDYDSFAVSAANGTLTGNGITLISIYGAVDSTGTSATKILDSAALTGTAVGNGGNLEITSEQLREVGAAQSPVLNLRYVTAYITVANSADEASVAFLRAFAHAPADKLTAASF